MAWTAAAVTAAFFAACASPGAKHSGPRTDLPAVAVMDFQGVGLSTGDASVAADSVRGALVKGAGKHYITIDRKSIDTILKNLKQDMAMGKDVDLAVRVGHLLGARIMVIGTVSKVQDDYYLDVVAVDAENAQIIAAATEAASSYRKLRRNPGRPASSWRIRSMAISSVAERMRKTES